MRPHKVFLLPTRPMPRPMTLRPSSACLFIQQRQKAVAGPHFCAGALLGFVDFGVYFAVVSVAEFAAQQSFLNFAGYSLPSEQVRDAVP